MLCNKRTQPISCWAGFKGQENLLHKGEKMNRLHRSFQTARAEKYWKHYFKSSFLLNCFPFSLICNGTTCRIPVYFPYWHTLALTECLNQMFKPPMLSQPTFQRPFVPLGKAVRSCSQNNFHDTNPYHEIIHNWKQRAGVHNQLSGKAAALNVKNNLHKHRASCWNISKTFRNTHVFYPQNASIQTVIIPSYREAALTWAVAAY